MIRAFREADLEALLALFRESVHGIGAADYTPEQLAAWAPAKPDLDEWRRRLSTALTLVAEDGGRLAGFVRVDEDGCIDLLYVHPDCAGRGIGSRLLREALDWLCEHGLTRAWTCASHTARPVFERAGFRVVEQRTVERDGVKIGNQVMVKSLDN